MRDDIMTRLEAAGINSGEGLGYCADDVGFYTQMLEGFADSSETRLSELERAYSEQDIKSYRISVHSIKSNSRTLGIDDLSDMALELENAARQEDTEFIGDHHNDFTEKYRSRAAQIRALLGKEDSHAR